jgi:hypothetical protein
VTRLPAARARHYALAGPGQALRLVLWVGVHPPHATRYRSLHAARVRSAGCATRQRITHVPCGPASSRARSRRGLSARR